MGALKSGAFPVELNGKEYGLLFSLNALDEVQEKFGGYDKLSEVWRKTPYQITTLFKYHKEYNPHIFRQEQAGTSAATENMDDIDIALGGF